MKFFLWLLVFLVLAPSSDPVAAQAPQSCSPAGWVASAGGQTLGPYADPSAACTAGVNVFKAQPAWANCTFYGEPCTWAPSYEGGGTCNAIRNGNTAYAISMTEAAPTCCPAGQTWDATTASCTAPDLMDQLCKDARVMHNSTLGNGGAPVIISGQHDSGFYCNGDVNGAQPGRGCGVELKVDMQGSSDGVNWRTWASYDFSGNACTIGPDAPASPTEVPTSMPSVTPTVPECPSPKIPGTATMNGVTVKICSPPISTVTPEEKKVDKENPGTPNEVTTETTKQTACGSSSCTSTTTVVIKNASGTVTGGSSSTSTSAKDSFCQANPNDKNCSSEDGGISDSGLPGQPSLYEAKYPDGLAGVWSARKAELMASPLVNVAGNLMPNISDGGQCPTWTVNLSIGPWDNGTHNVAPPCYIWSWAKFFIITGALLLARALIFGG